MTEGITEFNRRIELFRQTGSVPCDDLYPSYRHQRKIGGIGRYSWSCWGCWVDAASARRKTANQSRQSRKAPRRYPQRRLRRCPRAPRVQRRNLRRPSSMPTTALPFGSNESYIARWNGTILMGSLGWSALRRSLEQHLISMAIASYGSEPIATSRII